MDQHQNRKIMSDPELEKLRNEVLRKIGRNLLNYQQIERMLKFIVTYGNFKVSGKNTEEKLKQRLENIQKHTMGMLVDPYVKNTYLEIEEESISPEIPEELSIRFAFTVDSEDSLYEAEKLGIETIVADRNELVHHIIYRLDLYSVEGCLKADNELQIKNDILLSKIEYLNGLVLNLQELMKLHGQFLNSEEGIKQIELMFLQQSRIIRLLIDIASDAARCDGWTLLNIAGQLLKQYAPDEIAAINERYGHKTLKKLISASELFDLLEEPTNNGGIRLLYRIKPETTT